MTADIIKNIGLVNCIRLTNSYEINVYVTSLSDRGFKRAVETAISNLIKYGPIDT